MYYNPPLIMYPMNDPSRIGQGFLINDRRNKDCWGCGRSFRKNAPYATDGTDLILMCPFGCGTELDRIEGGALKRGVEGR